MTSGATAWGDSDNRMIANRIAAPPRRPMAHQLWAMPTLIRARAGPTLPEIIGVALYPETPHRWRLSDISPAVTLGEIDRVLAVREAQPVERGERVSSGRP